MRLLVGLGNPGRRYARNRHNIGFMALDAIVERHGFPPWREKFHGASAEGAIAGERVLALKPMTYMNDSGRSVAAAARFYKLAPADVIVIHDEIELKPGKIRVKQGGGHAGHNGLRDIDAHIGPDYVRVRLGVGRPDLKELVHPYVLQDFPKADEDWVTALVGAVADAAPLLLSGDANGFMSKVALTLNPPPPKPPRAAAEAPGEAAPTPAPPPSPGEDGRGD